MITTMRVQVPQETADRLEQRATEIGRPVELVATHALSTGALLPAAGRFITVTGEALQRLETLLGGGSIHSEADLTTKVERLAGISFAHVRLEFSPGQLEQLAEKAARADMTVEQLVERAQAKICEQFFGLLPV